VVVPFSIAITDNIDLDSVDFSITDFSYEVINDNTLKVFIEFSVIASEKEIIEEKEVVIFEDVKNASENEIELPDDEILEVPMNSARVEEDIVIEGVKEDRIDKVETETIMDSIKNENDEYALYHIHIVKEAETIEMISAMYNSSIDLISEYNDLTNIGIGDKLIIPEEKDE